MKKTILYPILVLSLFTIPLFTNAQIDPVKNDESFPQNLLRNFTGFNQTLKYGDSNEQVTLLQKILNLTGKTVAPAPEPGSLNNETTYYGSLTASAVKAFQCEKGIVCEGDETTTGWGQVGPKTRSLLNSLFSSLSSSFLNLKSYIVNLPPSSQTAAISGSGSGLVAHYTFDEGGGTTAGDSSGGGNTGTLVGGPTWVGGKIGSDSLSFSTNQYIDISGGSALDGRYPVTLQAWVKTSNSSSGMVVAGVYRSNNRDHYLQLWVNAGIPSLTVKRGSVSSGISGNSIADGSWHHLVAIFESSTSRRLYVDGVLVGASTESVDYPSFIGKLSIAAYRGNYSNQSPGSFFNGSLDDVRIYNRALSASEISELYTLGSDDGDTTESDPSLDTDPDPVINDDTTPPSISSVSATNINSTGATITWSTNEGATSQVQYGKTTSYGSNTSKTSSYATSHSVSLSGLESNAEYNYRVLSEDSSDNPAMSTNFTFMTSQQVAPTESGTCPTISIEVKHLTFIWNFNTTQGVPRCGTFANGDWWVSPAQGESSVILDSLTLQGGGILYLDENPRIESIGFLSKNYGNQNLSENILPNLPLSFSSDVSLVAVVQRDEATRGGCGTNAIKGSCVGAYNVLTVLSNVPPGNGADILRPSIDESTKKLISFSDFDLTRLPSKNYFTGTNASGLEDIRKRWSHSTEIFGIVSSTGNSYSEGGRAFRASYLIDDYATGVALGWNNDLASIFSDDHTLAEKKPALAAMLVYGKDLYDAVYDGTTRVRGWGGGAGQGLNKYPPAVLFAALARDTSYGATLKATTPALLDSGSGAPQELEQVNPGRFGPVWGDETTASMHTGVGSNLNRYWGTLMGSQCFDGATGTCSTSGGRRTLKDPYGYIDGPENRSGSVYMGVVLGQEAAFLSAMSLIPQMCEIVNYPEYAEYIDRVTEKGIQAQPDPCAPPDTREPDTCDPYRKKGCNYYGLSNTGTATWGPDPSNNSMCILDPDLAYYNSPTDFACKEGKTCGRFPDRHGIRLTGVYRSAQIDANWDAIRSVAVGLCARRDYSSTEVTTHTLSTSATNGTITKSPNKTSYTAGESVTLTATPSTGYSFTSWSGSATGSANPMTITMDGNKSVTATFNTTADTTPPTLSNLTVSNITTSGATVNWTTNESSDTQVEYGSTSLTTGGSIVYGSETSLNSSLVTSHSATLSNLSPSTTYNYRVKSRDSAGNLATSQNGTITTAEGDITPPSRSNGSPSDSLSSGTTSTTLSLTTNESATCRYSTTANTGYSSMTAFSQSGSTTHQSTISNLQNGQSYTYHIKCRDSAGNTNSSDYAISFSVSNPPSTNGSDSDNDGIPDTDDYCPSTPSTLASVVNKYGCPKPLASTFDIKPDFHALDLRSLSNLELGVGNYGKINWSESIPLLKDETQNQTTYKTRLSLDGNITFAPNKVTLNPSNLPEMNRQATITLHNISFTEPKIQRDGVSCPSTICSNITYDKTEKTLTFTVTGFSTYEVTEGYVPPSPPSGGGGGGGGSPSTSSTSSSQASSGSSSGGGTLALGSYTVPQDISGQTESEESEEPSSSCSSSIASSPELFPSLSSALTSSQIQSILNLLLAFQADQQVVNDVHCALLGYEVTSTPTSTTPAFSHPSSVEEGTGEVGYHFTEWLTIGKRSEAVRQLQIWLNNYSPSNSSGQVHPYQVAPSGLDSTGSPQAGSPGLETTYFGPATESALRRLQCDRLSVCSGTPSTTGYGGTGPRTRSVLNQN